MGRARAMAWQYVRLRRSLFFAVAPNANSTLHMTLFGTSEFATVAHRTAISLSYQEVLVFAKEERNCCASDGRLIMIIAFSRKSRVGSPSLEVVVIVKMKIQKSSLFIMLRHISKSR